MTEDVGIRAVLMKVRYDLTSAQGKLTEAIRVVDALDLDEVGDRVPCPRCELKFAGPNSLGEHLYTSHDGPLPAHWVAADGRVHEEDGA